MWECLRTNLVAMFITTVCAIFLFPAMGAEGSWKYPEEDDFHALAVFSDGETHIFRYVCSKYIGFEVKFPNQTSVDHDAQIRLSTTNNNLVLSGDLSDEDDGYNPSHTLMFSASLNGEGDKPDLVKKLFSMIESGMPITVSGGNSSYVLPGFNLPKKWLESRFNKVC
jgi:hypothetical protein